MNKFIPVFLIALLFFTVFGTMQSAQASTTTWRTLSPAAQKINPALQESFKTLAPTDMTTVIVTLRQQADVKHVSGNNKKEKQKAVIRALKDTANLTQGKLKKLLDNRKKTGLVEKYTSLWIINGISVTAKASVINELAADSDVFSITPDDIQITPAAGIPEPNIALVNTPALWGLNYFGQGVVVASMDSGVDVSHPDLATRWRGGSNSWFDPYGQHPTTPTDMSGHGTWTTGLMVAGDAGGTSIGVAPGAQWVAVKIFNDQGGSTATAIHLGFQWLLDPDGDLNTDDAPQVVNNSWTFAYPGCNLEFELDLQSLRAFGILPVFAAGNGGPYPNTSYSPSNNPSAFAVGATNNSDQIYAYSSRGPSTCGGSSSPYPKIVSPGVNTLSTGLYGTYYTDSGTSFAAPHVAGGLALLLSAYPNLDAAQQEQALLNSAVDLGAAGPDDMFGYGRLDLLAAFNQLATTPTVTPTPVGTPTDTPTPLPPSNTPTATNTIVPPSATNTPTNTPVPSTPTYTPTNTPIPPTVTNTPAGPTILSFTPIADANIASSSSSTNFGSTTTLQVDNRPVSHFLLKFDVTGVNGRPVTNAVLRLYNVDASTSGGIFYPVNDNTWQEGTVTWNTAPAAGATVLGSLGSVSPNNWYEVNLSSYINHDGTYSLRVSSTSSNGADYSSKEGNYPPQLVISIANSSSPTATNTALPTATKTPLPTATSTPTNTGIPPTATNTAQPPTATSTSLPPTVTSTALPPTITSIPPTPTNTLPAPGSDVIYLSSTSNGKVGGIAFNDEDILAYNTLTKAWSIYFDGSDVGITGDVNAFALMPDGSLLLSLDAPASLSGVGSVDDSDIVRFTPTSLGANTAGSFSTYFVGASAGLTTNGEDIDALDFAPDGRLVVSTVGSYSVPGVSGNDEDLIALDPSGASWSLYFDGSDVGLNDSSSEATNGVWIDPVTNQVYLTTVGAFNVAGLSGGGADIFICTPGSLGTTTACSFSSYWVGSLNGFTGQVVDGLDIVR